MADISKIKPLGSDTTYNIKDNSAIANITRSGTTFTATRRDGTTFTFTQQDNNSDTKVNVVARGTTKAYLLADTTAPTSTAAAHTAVAETGVYLDTTAATLVATTFKGDLTGNADTVTKLATARDINGIAFDGSQNINTPFYYDAKISQGSTTAGWYKFADYTNTSSGHTIKITYFIQRGWNKEQCGILEFDITLGPSGWSSPSLKWLIRTPAMPVDCIGCVVNGTTVTLYGYMDQTNQYGAMTITEIWKGNQGGERQHTSFTYYNSSTITTPTPTFTTQSSDNGIVDQANKATQDSDGNAINTTYIKKSVLSGAYDIMYSSAVNTPARLAANTTTTKKFLRMTGTGSAGATPAWDTVTSSDVGLGNVTNHQQVHEVAWDSTNKKVTRSKNGTAGNVVQFKAGTNISLSADSTSLTITNDATDTLTGTPGASKTITAFDQINGAVTATFADISITKSQITDFPTTMTPASHTHGNITNDGKLDIASVAVVTDSNKNITTADLSVSDPTASGTGITYISSISQSAVGKITATKSTVRSASTSQTGVIQITTDNANSFLNQLSTGSSTPVDADYYISQYVNGGTTTTTYHRRPMSALWSYIDGKITSNRITTATQYGVAYYSSTTKITSTAQGAANNALMGNGAAAPKWTAVSTTLTHTAGTSSAASKLKVTVLGVASSEITLTTATTGVYGMTKLTDSTSSTSTTTAATPNSVKSAYDLANNHKYWANIEATSAAQYDKEPVVKTVTVGNGSGATAPTKKVQLVYDASLEVLNFVFS